MERCDISKDVFENSIQQDIVGRLEKCLESNDLVILVDIEGANILVEILCHSKVIKNTSKKLAIVSCVNYPLKSGNHDYITVTETVMKRLLDIYRCYEPSDKLVLLSDSRNYGNTWNYVNTGIISIEDVFEAMLA